MKLLLVALLSCGLITFANAQTKKEITPIPISYIRDVPSFARKLMSAQSKSLFWGKFSLNPHSLRKQHLQGNNKPIPQVTTKGFHLYALYAPELKHERGTTCHLALDIFELKPTPKLLNRVFVTSKNDWAPTLWGMSFTWLDPKESEYSNESKTRPLLIIRSFTKGIYGPIGIESFVTFNEGWKGQTITTNLKFGAWRASDTGGEVNELIPGRDGLIGIHASLSPTTSELTPEQVEKNYNFTLTWDYDQENFIPHTQNEKLIQDYYTRLQQ